MNCDCGHDLEDDHIELEGGLVGFCKYCECNSPGITEIRDMIFVPEYFKTSTYNLREPFSYIAVGSSI